MNNQAPNLSAITVDTLIDESDGNLAAGNVSLREALAIVSDGGRITFDSSLASQNTGAGQGVIELSLGTLSIDKSVTIDGLGADQLKISGADKFSVFSVDDGNDQTVSDVSIQNITISEGAFNTPIGLELAAGGGIFNREKLSVANIHLTSNDVGISGIGDDSGQASLLVQDSIISGNTRGINWGKGESVTIQNSEVTNNGRNNYFNFGGIVIGTTDYTSSETTSLQIIDTLVEGNIGGGISSSGDINIKNSRVLNNQGNGISGSSRYTGSVAVENSTVSGNSDTGVFTYSSGNSARITITASTVSNNKGGSIESSGIGGSGGIELQSSLVSNNGDGLSSSSRSGGSISVIDSQITNNEGNAAVLGSDIVIKTSSLSQNKGTGLTGSNISVEQSSITGNKKGGIFIVSSYYIPDAIVEVNNSTISGNGSSSSEFGGVYSSRMSYGLSSVKLNNTTVSGNTGTKAGGLLIAEPYGDGNYDYDKTIIKNSIIAANIGSDVVGNVVSLGYNLIGDGSDANGFVNTDLVGTQQQPIDPKLGELKNNGGPTLTQKPRSGSIAIDSGTPNANASGFDQRGPDFRRVVDGDSDGNMRIDIGAVEAADAANPPNPPNPPSPLNVIEGNNRPNRLRGSHRADLMRGFGGSDNLNGGNGNDVIEAAAGFDRLLGGNGRDQLFGNSGNDKLNGGRGNDLLNGGTGNDLLRGGQGRDTFVYTRVNDGKDTVTDFHIRQDRFDLSAILSEAGYDSTTPFEDYIRIGQRGQNNSTVSVLDLERSQPNKNVFRELAIIRNVVVAELSKSNFML